MSYLFLFIEGILTFISPCFLPMLPVYLSYFGTAEADNTWDLFKKAFAFVLGFTVIFVALGLTASGISKFLIQHRSLITRIGGMIMIFLGLKMLGLFRLPSRGKKGSPSLMAKPQTILDSFLFGILIAFSWSPCLSIFLTAALLEAAKSSAIWQGGLKLLAFSLGLGIPFIASALLAGSATHTFDFLKKHERTIQRISGVFLILLGLLMATDQMLWYTKLFY